VVRRHRRRWFGCVIKGAGAAAEASGMDAPGPLALAGDHDELALEDLTRRLLELLGRVTGLQSTYLTTIDWEAGFQRILYARNAGALDIPEGLEVAWSDTLCRRALENGPLYTTEVPSAFPDSDAARALGLRTYMTVPVIGPAGEVFGTVCGVDARRIEVDADGRAVMETRAEMVSLHLIGIVARRELERTNRTLSELAFVDALTGVGNRRALDRGLAQSCEDVRGGGGDVSVVTVDVDHFKEINDDLGHAAGDAVLREVAHRLTTHCRTGDVVARHGGDEFVAVLVGADVDVAAAVARRLCADVAAAPILTDAGPVQVTLSIGVAAGGSDADPGALLGRADRALYLAKEAGRNGVGLQR
jgi:diguanylate cyclase